MKEYTRRLTGVISNYSSCPYVDGRRIDDIVAEMVGKNCNFAGTVSIVITDLTADTGAQQERASPQQPDTMQPPAAQEPDAAVEQPDGEKEESDVK